MKFMNDCLKDKKIIVFGTGRKSEDFLNKFSCEYVSYFIDNNKNKQGNKFMGKMVFHPNKLKKEKKDKIFIVVASMFYDEISNQLRKLDFIEGIHFLDDNSVLKTNTIFDVKDILAMQYLQPLYPTYYPWSSAAMRPSGLVKVVNEIMINQRKTIVECGGGISTVLIAKLINEFSGKLYTIEHSKEWAVFLENLLKKYKLNQNVYIIYSPLRQIELSIGKGFWYECKCIERVIPRKKVDFLIVDGPPSYPIENKYSRYFAVPFFWDYFAEDFSILLDDINRQGEKEIITLWEKEYNIKFKRYYIDGGVAVYRRKEEFAI